MAKVPVVTKVKLAHEDEPLVLRPEGILEAAEAGELKAVYKLIGKRQDSEGRTGSAIITSLVADRDGDIVLPSGVLLDAYMENPVVLLNHDHSGLPIGRTIDIKGGRKRLTATWEFAEKDQNPIAEYAYRLWKGKFLNATSIGFLPKEVVRAEEVDGEYHGIEFSGLLYRKWELLEFSVVTVPANQEALRTDEAKRYWPAVVKAAGGGVWEVPEMEEPEVDVKVEVEGPDEPKEKGAISYARAHPNGTPKAPEDTPWDAGAEVRAASVDDLKVMCAWVDSANADNKTAYKLPHHKAAGAHAVVWRGVAAAMAALLGARGGVDIPDADRRGVYNHLVRHYREFDKEPPEFRDYSGEALMEMFPEAYADLKCFEDVRMAFVAGALSPGEAFALVERQIKELVVEISSLREEAASWKREAAALAARIVAGR